MCALRNDASGEQWHKSRGQTLREPFRSRCDGCGTRRHVRAWCATCGEVHAFPVGCGLTGWCPTCAERRKKRARRKLIPAFKAAVQRELEAWDGKREHRPAVRLLTLGVRSSGDAVADRETIRQGWVRFRAWLHHRMGSVPFVLAWECTGKGDQLPHVHAHVATVWRGYLDVQEAAAEWVRATEGAAEAQGFDVVWDIKRKDGTREKVDAYHAADYAAKYASKGANPWKVSRDTWCEWEAARAGKRSYTTSKGLMALAGVETAPPPCCADAGAWGGASIGVGPPPAHGVSVLTTGPPVSRETVADP